MLLWEYINRENEELVKVGAFFQLLASRFSAKQQQKALNIERSEDGAFLISTLKSPGAFMAV